jgi:hypothetical protein
MSDNEEFRNKLLAHTSGLPELIKYIENADPFELNAYHELYEKIKRELFDFDLALKLRYDKIRGLMT